MKTIRIFLAGALMWLAWAGGAAEAAPLFVENFNAGPGGFSVETPTAYDGPWVYNAQTGSWREDGQQVENGHANTSKLLSPVVTVPSAGFVAVTFTHRYSFEFDGARFDGGQLLVSVNGGAFTTVPDAAFGENGYGGQTVAASSGSVLAGQPAFTAESPGYATSFIVSRASLGHFNPGDVVQVEIPRRLGQQHARRRAELGDRQRRARDAAGCDAAGRSRGGDFQQQPGQRGRSQGDR